MVRKVLGVIAMIAACTMASAAEPPPPTEYQIKAAFLYNFAKFVEWPATALRDPGAPIIVAVLGEDPFGADLEQTLNGKSAGGRRVLVRRFKGVRDLEFCHILFISPSEKEHLRETLRALKNSNILTVGESDGFARLGGMINFIPEENRVRFEINIDAADRAGLKISSKLLKLAKIIRDR